MQRLSALCHWLGHPFRCCAKGMTALVNLTQRQVKALFSIGMLGGIVALSLQNIGLIVMVRQALGDASPGSLFGQMALNQQWWNNAIMAGFGFILGLIVFGADWVKARWGDREFGAGKGPHE